MTSSEQGAGCFEDHSALQVPMMLYAKQLKDHKMPLAHAPNQNTI